jgi:hypothetical protein
VNAAVLRETGGPPVCADVDEPVAGEGQVIVEMAAAAIHHVDLARASGSFYLGPPRCPRSSAATAWAGCPTGAGWPRPASADAHRCFTRRSCRRAVVLGRRANPLNRADHSGRTCRRRTVIVPPTDAFAGGAARGGTTDDVPGSAGRRDRLSNSSRGRHGESRPSGTVGKVTGRSCFGNIALVPSCEVSLE